MTGTDASPYSLSTTQDIHVAATDLNRSPRSAAAAGSFAAADAGGGGEDLPNGGGDRAAISMDLVSGWNAWTFAWIRWFYVRSAWTTNPLRRDAQRETATRTAIAGRRVPQLKLAYEDCCAMNVESLLNQFRRDQQQHGEINASLYRTCWHLCQPRILLASLLQLLFSASWIIALMVCFSTIMSSAEHTWILDFELDDQLTDNNDTVVAGYNSTDDLIQEHQHHDHLIALNAGLYVLIMCGIVGLKSAANSVALRAAIMLRNACAGAVCQTALNSPVDHPVRSHQLMSLCAEDGETIMDMVLKGALILPHSLAICLCFVLGVIMLNWMVLIAFIGVAIIIAVAALMAASSRQFYRKSQKFTRQKLCIVEEYFAGLDDREHLSMHESFKKRFAAAVSGQFWALFRAESLRPSFSGAMCVYLMLMCVLAISIVLPDPMEHSGNLMALSMVFIVVMHFLMSDLSDAFVALMKGQTVVARIQAAISQNPTSRSPIKSDDCADRVLITNATFQWADASAGVKSPLVTANNEHTHIEQAGFKLSIEHFRLDRAASVIGVTGLRSAGKSSLVHALLGHMPHRSGDWHCAGRVAFYPEQPYILEDGSLRRNICWSNVGAFNERRYTECLATVQLHLNAGYDRERIDRGDLDRHWLQKISLARAMYNEIQEIIVLENPLYGLDSDTEISDIFSDVVTQLLLQRKSVIVVSRDDNILRHCNEVYILENGTLGPSMTYSVLAQSEAYAYVKNEFNQELLNRRNKANTNSLQTAITISTEDLVGALPVEPAQPAIFNPLETFYLVLLHFLNVNLHVSLPLSDMMYIHYTTMSAHHFALFIVVVLFAISLLFSAALVKHYSHRVGRRYTKRLQKDIFDKTLNTKVSAPAAQQSQLVYALNTLLDGNFRAFQTRAQSVYSWLVIVVTHLVVGLLDSVLLMLVVILLVNFVWLYFGLRATMAEAGESEIASRGRLFRHVHNDVQNRAVLQSTDGVLQARNRIFNLIEKNSSTVYLQRSVIYFGQFVLDVSHCLTLPIMFVCLHFDEYRHENNYIVSLYMFYMVLVHLCSLLDLRFSKLVADQKLVNARKFIQNSDFKNADNVDISV